ncbi:outer membrane protein transport protein [Gracilimonas sp.]|uniref:outer membrane protein transport protein n=1 Tax=Gracilimonas sp. TaxID=1974203 RepID=UPI002871721A|nr:outer membrane protein transport protein [Gracilimonas sp.]
MKRILILLLPLLFSLNTVYAQDGNSPVTYSNLALQFGKAGYNSDAATGFFPTVATENGYGSYLDNPASVALISESYFSFGLKNNTREYESIYLGNSVSTEESERSLGNIGFVYNLPTKQGSFVIGGGYNNLIDDSQNTILSARNDQSTITDAFKDPSSDYYDLAFNTYAIDWGDVDSTYLESIFRIGFDDFPGITQEADVSYSTNIGEYSVFFGTEFQPNLFVGISAGITVGEYTYRRDFLEVDDRNDYNYEFIPSDVEGEFTDIDNILTHDEIDADIVGYNISTGLIYELNERINLGVSYKIPSTMVIKEEYYSSIKTELDDGSTPFESDLTSQEKYEYRVKKPGQLNIGITAKDLQGFDLSFSGQFINYSNLSLDLISGNDFNFDDEVVIRDQQDELDAFMSDNYKSVFNYKAGLSYTVNDLLKLKSGYAFFEGKSKVYEADRDVYSAGFSANITNNIILDVTGQYLSWSDRSVAYFYTDFETGQNASETIDHEISNIRVLAGLRILF